MEEDRARNFAPGCENSHQGAKIRTRVRKFAPGCEISHQGAKFHNVLQFALVRIFAQCENVGLCKLSLSLLLTFLTLFSPFPLLPSLFNAFLRA